MTANDIIKIALDEVGYIGKKTAAQLDEKESNQHGNYTKYARDLYNAGYYNGNKNGYSFCCVFVDWLFYIAAGRDKETALKCKNVSLYGAAVDYVAGAMPGRTYTVYDAVPGDQILFKVNGELTHTGIVIAVTDDEITTVEGNTAGNVVRQKTYKKNDNYLAYVVRPYYDSTTITIDKSEYEKLKNIEKFYNNLVDITLTDIVDRIAKVMVK